MPWAKWWWCAIRWAFEPLCYAKEGPLFAAASESVALLNLGFQAESIKSLLPGQMVAISPGGSSCTRSPDSPRKAHCFFEWIYFANVASTMDERSVYLTRKHLGEELARLETLKIDKDTVVVPVPDTSKAAADAMAYELSVPAVEGLIRNRYAGRTFIEGGNNRRQKAETKYTPLREVLEGKRVILVEDSIVRSTTMKVLIHRIREMGRAREIHVRVACPPIIAPCFYGIDMSTIGELFAPQFLRDGQLPAAAEAEMAQRWGPIRCAICPWNRSHGPSASTPTNCARPASRANTRRRTGKNSIKLRCNRRTIAAASEHTRVARRCEFSELSEFVSMGTLAYEQLEAAAAEKEIQACAEQPVLEKTGSSERVRQASAPDNRPARMEAKISEPGLPK